MDRKKTILDRLDDSVRWTGLAEVAQARPRRRHLRWLPVVALTTGTAGMLTVITWPQGYHYFIGHAGVIFGFLIGSWLPLFGPLKPWGTLEAVDEFDRALRRDAFFVGFATISIVAFLGIWLLVGVTVTEGLTRDALLRAMTSFGLYLLSLYSAVPTLYASWTTRPIIDDDSDC